MASIRLSALLTALLVLSSCGHSRKVAETPPPERTTPPVSYIIYQEEDFMIPEEAPAPKKRAAVMTTTRQTPSDLALTRAEPDRDIASVPAATTPSPLVQTERRWLPWMTIGLGLLLAGALAVSVRSIRGGPKP